MTKSELFKRIFKSVPYIPKKVIDAAVKEILEYMVFSLTQGNRVEIRGFGSFSLHYRHSRTGRNPKTGTIIYLENTHVPYFKASKQLRDRVNI
ncbi:Integration host factor subunit beta [Buchnera aphidicola (Pemphigus populi)]